MGTISNQLGIFHLKKDNHPVWFGLNTTSSGKGYSWANRKGVEVIVYLAEYFPELKSSISCLKPWCSRNYFPHTIIIEMYPPGTVEQADLLKRKLTEKYLQETYYGQIPLLTIPTVMPPIISPKPLTSAELNAIALRLQEGARALT